MTPHSTDRVMLRPRTALALAFIASACTMAEPVTPTADTVTPDTSPPDTSIALDTTDSTSTSDTDVDIDIALEPPPPVLVRLTQRQLEHALDDLFGPGLALPSALEPDAPADGLLTAGGSVNSVSNRGVELYEDLALSIGEQALATPERRARIVPCSTVDAACRDTFTRSLGRLAWRRPLTEAEVTQLTDIGAQAEAALGTFDAGLSWVIATLLQSPHFLYRFEAGEPAPPSPNGSPAPYRYTSIEMASRLAFFFWASPPDDALLTAGLNGDLVDDTLLATHIDRLIADPKARRSIRGFFSEWLHLHDLSRLNKDPTIFKHFSADLGDLAAEETLRLAEHLFVDASADLRDLLLTRTTFIERRLASIYNVPAPALEGFAMTELPPTGERRGLLGQVSFLALHSHPTSSSATLRGLFLRETLLCDFVPDPPSNLNTAIPEPSPDLPTLRDRLAAHREIPTCASCHTKTDVPGLGFELFDGIGRFRLTENDAPIDASGRLDGVDFDGPAELSAVVADHPDFTTCAVKKLYTYAVARPTTDGEDGQLSALTDAFITDGRRIDNLMKAIAMSPGFRHVGGVTP